MTIIRKISGTVINDTVCSIGNVYGSILTGTTSIKSPVINGTTCLISPHLTLSALSTKTTETKELYIGAGGIVTSGISTVNNGLTKQGTNIKLGGTLTGNTTINLSDKIFNINNALDGFSGGTGFNGAVKCVATQIDGKILVGGSFTTYKGVSSPYIIRLNPDGSKDTTFVIGTGFNGDVNTIQIQSDYKILVGGSFTTYSGITNTNKIIRLNLDGSKDSTFNVGTGFNNSVNTIAISYNTNKIYVGGSFTTFNGNLYFSGLNAGVIRLNLDGSKDIEYVLSIIEYNLTEPLIITGNSTVNTISINYDEILIGGDFAYTTASGGYTYYNFFITDKFGSLGIWQAYDPYAFDGTINTIVSETSGGFFVGGSFTTFNSVSYPGIVKLTYAGAEDTSFIVNTGFNGTVKTIAIQVDSKILVGGSFTTYQGVGTSNIIRLNAIGSKDTSFVIGNGFNGDVNAITLINGGSKIYVGGNYTEYNSSSYIRIIRIYLNGNVDNQYVTSDVIKFDSNKTCIIGEPYLYCTPINRTSDIVYYNTTFNGLSVGKITAGYDGSVQYNNNGCLNGTGLIYDDSIGTFGFGSSANVSSVFNVYSPYTDYHLNCCYNFLQFGMQGGYDTAQLCIGGSFMGVNDGTHTFNIKTTTPPILINNDLASIYFGYGYGQESLMLNGYYDVNVCSLMDSGVIVQGTHFNNDSIGKNVHWISNNFNGNSRQLQNENTLYTCALTTNNTATCLFKVIMTQDTSSGNTGVSMFTAKVSAKVNNCDTVACFCLHGLAKSNIKVCTCTPTMVGAVTKTCNIEAALTGIDVNVYVCKFTSNIPSYNHCQWLELKTCGLNSCNIVWSGCFNVMTSLSM